MNSFTVEEIKESVYYKWRIYNSKIDLATWGVISAITVLVPLFTVLSAGSESLVIGFAVWGVMVVIYGLIFVRLAIIRNVRG